MDELREGVKQYGIEVFYNSPTVSRDDSKCENEHSYEGHESEAPYMSLTEEEGEDKDVEKDAEKDAERDNDEDDTQEEKSFPFPSAWSNTAILSKSIKRTAEGESNLE
jgi:hypothetical protein